MKNIRLMGLLAVATLSGDAIVAVAQPAPVASTAPMANGIDFTRIPPGSERWVDYPGDGKDFGLKEAYIYGDPTKPGLYVIRLKFPPGVMSSPHSHPEDRIGIVISGTWWTGIGDKFDPASTKPIGPGGLVVQPKGLVHYDGARDTELVVQMMGIGPTGKFVKEKGAPGFIRVK